MYTNNSPFFKVKFKLLTLKTLPSPELFAFCIELLPVV